MTKKHFIELADHLRKPGMMPAAIERTFAHYGLTMPGVQEAVLQTIATELADFCKAQNGCFDRQRWLSYIAGECGPNGGAVKVATNGK